MLSSGARRSPLPRGLGQLRDKSYPLFNLFPKTRQHIALSPDGDILRLISMLYVHSQRALREVAHMTAGGVHLIVGTQKFF